MSRSYRMTDRLIDCSLKKMPKLFLSLAVRVFILAFILMLLGACRGPAAPKPPDPGIQPPLPNPTGTPIPTPAAAAQTPLPTPTPLPWLQRPIIWYLRGE